MVQELNNLIKISTLAKIKDVSVECVRKWIREGKVEVIKIDGVAFIDVKKLKI